LFALPAEDDMDFVNLTLHPMTTEVSGGPVFEMQSPIFDVSGYKTLHTVLAVQAVQGAGAVVNCALQDGMDGNIWRPLGTLSLGAVGPPAVLDSTNFGRFLRVTFTYGPAGTAVMFSLLAIAREF
jgi:hypothetical protein